LLAQGLADFGPALLETKLARIDSVLTGHVLNFPGSKAINPHIGLCVYPISKTPFVVLYDFDDAEVRVHFIVHRHASLDDIDPKSVDW
jgi:hypothetical protein